MPLTIMDEEGEQEFLRVLESISPGGQTNLSEGLLWGLGELAASDAPCAAAFVFTDGLANMGITQTCELTDAMRGPMADMGSRSRAVFTFGFGSEHNASMLFSLADAGTGCYYYVDTPDAIGPSFADCLGGLLSVVAQDVVLTFQASAGVAICDVNAGFPVEASDDGREMRIRMRDLSAEVEKDVLVNFEVPALEAPRAMWSAMQCMVSYIYAGSGEAVVQTQTMYLDRSEEVDERSNMDTIVELHRCRLLAAAAMEQAATLSGNGALEKDVLSVLAEACAALERSQARKDASASSTMDGLLADLRLCLEHVSDRRACEKWCSSRAFTHKHQISTRAEGSEYRNTLQQQMAEAARQEIACMPLATPPKCKRRGRGGAPSVCPTSKVAGFTNAGETILAGSLRKGMRLVCPRSGKPGTAQDITHSKAGKHGHAKILVTVLGDDGITREFVAPTVHEIQLAM